MGALHFASQQERESGSLQLPPSSSPSPPWPNATAAGLINSQVLDNAKTYNPMIVLDNDDRLIEARCDCYFYGHNKLMRGPCEHMLALRRLYHGQVALPPSHAQARGGAA